MAEKRNLTVQLDVEVIRQARILAAERSVSVSRLVAEQIERLVGDEARYRAARERALDNLERGFYVIDGPLPSRDELYDR